MKYKHIIKAIEELTGDSVKITNICGSFSKRVIVGKIGIDVDNDIKGGLLDLLEEFIRKERLLNPLINK